MNQKYLRRAAALLCAGTLALTGAGCTKTAVETVAQEAIVPVDVQAPKRGSLAVKNEYIGRVMPDQSVSVFAKMSGEVLSAPFNVGDTVRAGQLLLQVDGAAVYASVNQAKAAYDAAQVNAEQALGTGYDSNLIKLEAAMNAAEARFLRAKSAVKKIKDEGGDDYGYNPQYASARTEQTDALEAYNAAKASYDLAKNAGYDDAVKSSNAGLAQAEAAYKVAAQNLNNLVVTAPISGVIEAKNFDVHDMASPQAPAYVISNKDVMTVTFNVPASAVPAMTLGDVVEIDNNGLSHTGEIVEVGSIANEQSGLFPVKARIDGDISALLSGISVKVTASSRKVDDVLLVPVSSVVNESGRQYVYVVSPEGRAVKTLVETGITDDVEIEIISGLTGAERIVTTWSPDLSDGALLDSNDITVSAPEDAVSEPEEETDASSADETPAVSSAAPVSPKTVTSQTAPAKPAASSQPAASSSSQAEGSASTPASERESLIEKAGDEDLPEPLVPDEVQAGDESSASEVQ